MLKLHRDLFLVLCLFCPLPTGAVAQALIHVAPPIGDQKTDRQSIVTALELAGPGDTIQFDTGTYEVGLIIRVDTPKLTLLGHPDGTTLRGGDFDKGGGFEAREGPPDSLGVLHLFEGGSTVRGLTFADSWWGLILGWHYGFDNDDREPERQGGFLIEGNTFRDSQNGVRATSAGPALSVIRDNTFIDVHFGAGGLGSGFRFENNRFTMSDAPRAQGYGAAIRVGAEHVFGAAADNHVVGNTIEGYWVGIGSTTDGVRKASGNVFRRNTITVRSEVEGSIGIHLRHRTERGQAVTQPSDAGEPAPTVVEGNHITGAARAGIDISPGYGDVRVVNNTFANLGGPEVLRGGAF